MGNGPQCGSDLPTEQAEACGPTHQSVASEPRQRVGDCCGMRTIGLGSRSRANLQPSRLVLSILVETLNDWAIDREARASERCPAWTCDEPVLRKRENLELLA